MATVAIAAVGTIVSVVAQSRAKDAAEQSANAQAAHQQALLARQESNQRVALRENVKRQESNKVRQLAQLRVTQAAGGFNTTNGTQLAIFGDIETRLDEQVNEQISQGLDAIGDTRNQSEAIGFTNQVQNSVRDAEFGANVFSTVAEGASDVFGAAKKNFNATGKGANPFGIFNN